MDYLELNKAELDSKCCRPLMNVLRTLKSDPNLEENHQKIITATGPEKGLQAGKPENIVGI